MCISPGHGVVLEYAPGDIVADGGVIRPLQAAAQVGEDGVGGCAIGDQDSLEGIGLLEEMIIPNYTLGS